MEPFGVLPREQHLGRRSGRQRQPGSDRNRVSQARRELGRRDAHPHVALASVELRAFTGRIAQLRKHRAGDRDQPVFAAGCRELRKPGSEHEAALTVAGDEAVSLEGDGQAVRGRPRETGECDETRQ